MTKASASITYASVVSRETVRIALIIATLNDFEVKLGDILNVNVQAPVTESCGPVWAPGSAKMLQRLQ